HPRPPLSPYTTLFRALPHGGPERHSHLGVLPRAAQEAPHAGGPGADPGQGEVEEGPGLPGEAVGHPEPLEQVERERFGVTYRFTDRKSTRLNSSHGSI